MNYFIFLYICLLFSAMESLKSKVKQNGLPAKRKTEQPASANQKKKPKVDLEQPGNPGYFKFKSII